MKQLFLFMLLLLFLQTGCSTSKKVTDHTTASVRDHTQVDVVHSAAEEVQTNGRQVVVVFDTQQMEEQTTVRDYDTSVPADSVTGKPPLVRETTTVRRATGKRQTTSKAANSSTAVSSDTLVDKTRVDTVADTDRSYTETKKTCVLPWWMWTALAAAAAFGVFVLRKRLFGVIGKLFLPGMVVLCLASCAARRQCECVNLEELRKVKWEVLRETGRLSDREYLFLISR